MTEYSVESLELRESSFYTRFPKNIALGSFPRFARLYWQKATWWWRWAWSICVITQTGRTELLGENPVAVPLFPPKRSHWLTWTEPGLRGEGPATNRLTQGTTI